MTSLCGLPSQLVQFNIQWTDITILLRSNKIKSLQVSNSYKITTIELCSYRFPPTLVGLPFSYLLNQYLYVPLLLRSIAANGKYTYVVIEILKMKKKPISRFYYKKSLVQSTMSYRLIHTNIWEPPKQKKWYFVWLSHRLTSAVYILFMRIAVVVVVVSLVIIATGFELEGWPRWSHVIRPFAFISKIWKTPEIKYWIEQLSLQKHVFENTNEKPNCFCRNFPTKCVWLNSYYPSWSHVLGCEA